MGSEIKWHELIDIYSSKISFLPPKEQMMMSVRMVPGAGCPENYATESANLPSQSEDYQLINMYDQQCGAWVHCLLHSTEQFSHTQVSLLERAAFLCRLQAC